MTNKKEYNEHQFQPEYAQKYGVNAAILLHNFIYWVTTNKTNKTHFCDGRTWIYDTIEAFTKQYIYLTEKQIKYALNILRKENVIIAANYNKRKSDRTLWYAFVNEKDFIPDEIMKIVQDIDENLLKNKQALAKKNKPQLKKDKPLSQKGKSLATKGQTLPSNIAADNIAADNIQKESKAVTDDFQSSEDNNSSGVNNERNKKEKVLNNYSNKPPVDSNDYKLSELILSGASRKEIEEKLYEK